MLEHLSVYPKKKFKAFNSCSLWYSYQILCLINYNENVQSKKYSEEKNIVNSIKNYSFYFDCFNYCQYGTGFKKK